MLPLVHDVAVEESHVSVDDSPDVIDEGLAVNVVDGPETAPVTVMVIDLLVLPPSFTHVIT